MIDCKEYYIKRGDEIFNYYLQTGCMQKEIAKKYGINDSFVSEILTKKFKERKEKRMDKRKLVDEKLEEMAQINCKLGKDSTTQEIIASKNKCDALMKEIKKIDPEFFKAIMEDTDKK